MMFFLLFYLNNCDKIIGQQHIFINGKRKQMIKALRKSLVYTIGMIIGIGLLGTAIAETIELPVPDSQTPTNRLQPYVTPTPPQLDAKSYILLDANSGTVLAEQDADEVLEPASLTKLMTVYLASEALKDDRLKLDDEILISEKAWRTGGSRMFIQVGDKIKANDLIQGIVVQSGNDASVAIAEYLAGSESSFADLMNHKAQQLGMRSSHFRNSTGLPNSEHYSTARDLAILSRAIIHDFPEDYKWYSQKWFTFNDIRQPNRNRLLWRNPLVDGLKTGHTDKAGYCLVSSAIKDNMRLIAVVMGASSDNARTEDSQRLLTYGFRFFESHKLYPAEKTIKNRRVWKGRTKYVAIGTADDLYVTTPAGQLDKIRVDLELPDNLQAPLTKGETVGYITIYLEDTLLSKTPVVALNDIPKGNLYHRLRDFITRTLQDLLAKVGIKLS
jgi:D-alanyl-D-alanine carboxypeptidase (penicillin-binding protein 5/6)